MRITRLYTPSGDPEHVRAVLDHEEELKVDADMVATFGLYVGMELDGETLDALRAAIARRKTRNRALRLAGSRPMSRKELTDRLRRRGSTEEDAAEAADWMEHLGAVDDGEYARMIVRHYSEKGFGPAKVRSELYRRGIPKELWEDALGELPEEEETIERVLEARLSPHPDGEEIKKLMGFLQRRGFGYETIRAALGRYITDMGEYE